METSSAINRWITKRGGDFCPVCRVTLAKFTQQEGAVAVSCNRCGGFSLADETIDELNAARPPDVKELCAVSSFLRENPGQDLTFRRWQELRQIRYPNVGERAEKLLKALADLIPTVGAQTRLLCGSEADDYLKGFSWSIDEVELSYLLNSYLETAKGWLYSKSPLYREETGLDFLITPAGHEHLDELRKGSFVSEQGFCAMWFGAKVAPAWRDAIRPAIEDAGYRPMRLDEHEHANRIDDEILAQIRCSKFVVSDFTGHRGGVYFEAGFALGLGRPVIWTIHKDAVADVHFDNRQYNFIEWDDDDLPGLRKRLADRIVAILGPGPVQRD